MQKVFGLLFIILFSVFIAQSANTLLWHFDPFNYDYYKDPESGGSIDDSIDCAFWIKKSLDAGGYNYDYHYDTLLPASIDDYKVVIGALGFYHC